MEDQELGGFDRNIILVDIYNEKSKIFTIALEENETTKELISLLNNIIKDEYHVKSQKINF